MAAQALYSRCPACGAANRIPVNRVGEGGKCGRCKQPLPAGDFSSPEPIDLPEAKFAALTRLSKLPVLIDFWAEWCAPCRQQAPLLAELARTWQDRILIAKVDTEAAPATAARFGIRSIPTLVLLRSGIEVDRIVGLMPLEALRQRLSRFVQ